MYVFENHLACNLVFIRMNNFHLISKIEVRKIDPTCLSRRPYSQKNRVHEIISGADRMSQNIKSPDEILQKKMSRDKRPHGQNAMQYTLL